MLSFLPLDGVTRVQVHPPRIPSTPPVEPKSWDITDQSRIMELVSFLEGLSTGWRSGKPDSGVPVLNVRLFGRAESQGSIAAANGAFVAEYQQQSLVRRATVDELLTFYTLLGLPRKDIVVPPRSPLG